MNTNHKIKILAKIYKKLTPDFIKMKSEEEKNKDNVTFEDSNFEEYSLNLHKGKLF